MKAFSMTDTGKSREMNQDYLFVSKEPVGNLPNLFIVADGMGGHNAGDYASRYAVETITKAVERCKYKNAAAIFEYAVTCANEELVLKAAEDMELAGMGTTAVLATFQDEQLWVANVGDSRLYVVNDKIKQITRDHSLVEEMVRRGELAKERARMHPDKNIITRAIGATDDISVDIFEVELGEMDRILMCSDGLTNMVDDEEIREVLGDYEKLEDSVDELIRRANQYGGKDNISVIVIEPFSGEVKVC